MQTRTYMQRYRERAINCVLIGLFKLFFLIDFCPGQIPDYQIWKQEKVVKII